MNKMTCCVFFRLSAHRRLAVALVGIALAGACGGPDSSVEGPRKEKSLRAEQRRVDAILSDLEGHSPLERAEAAGGLGVQYLARGRSGSAEFLLEQAAELDSEDARWHYYLGHLYEEDGRPHEAMAAFEAAHRAAPSHGAIHLRLGELALAQGEQALARHELALDQEDRVQAQGELSYAQDSLGKAGRSFSELSSEEYAPAALYGLGRKLAASGNDEQAVRYFLRALWLAPQAHEVYEPLAECYRRMEDFSKAMEAAAKVGPGEVPAPDPYRDVLADIAAGRGLQAAYCRLDLATGRTARAEAECRRALEENPADAFTQRLLAKVLLARGATEEAIAAYRRALQLDPTVAEAHSELGAVLMESGDLEEAERAFEESVRLRPESPEPWKSLVEIARSADRTEDALKAQAGWLEAAKGKVPPEEIVVERAYRAMTLAHLHRRDEALAEVRRWGMAMGELPRARIDDVTWQSDPTEPLAKRYEEREDWEALGVVLEAGYQGRGQWEWEPALNLGQFLLFAPEPELRDPARALQLIQEGKKATSEAAAADLLATALAANGRFDDAAAVQERLLDFLRRLGAQREVLSDAESRLAAYRRGEVWAGSSAAR